MNSKLKKLEDQLEQVINEMNLYHGSDIVGCMKCDKLEDKIEELKDKLGIPPS